MPDTGEKTPDRRAKKTNRYSFPREFKNPARNPPELRRFSRPSTDIRYHYRRWNGGNSSPGPAFSRRKSDVRPYRNASETRDGTGSAKRPRNPPPGDRHDHGWSGRKRTRIDPLAIVPSRSQARQTMQDRTRPQHESHGPRKSDVRQKTFACPRITRAQTVGCPTLRFFIGRPKLS